MLQPDSEIGHCTGACNFPGQFKVIEGFGRRSQFAGQKKHLCPFIFINTIYRIEREST